MSVPGSTQRFFGSLLTGVGFLSMVLCGACSTASLFFVVPSAITLARGLQSGQSGEEEAYAQMFVASFVLLGLIPILIGWMLFLLGRRLRRDAQPPKPKGIWPPPDADLS